MSQLFKNNARTTLAATLLSATTVGGTFAVASTKGTLFPAPGVGEYFDVTLQDATHIEIIRCDARSGDTLTILERDREPTLGGVAHGAHDFLTGTIVALRLTAAAVVDTLTHPAVSTAAHVAAAIVTTPAGALTSVNVQDALNELDTEKEVAGTAAAAMAAHLADTVDAHDASAIRYAGNGATLTSITVEAALDELDTEKQPLDATLTALAGMTVGAANLVPVSSGTDTFTTKTLGTASGNIPVVGTASATAALAGLVELADSAETSGLADTGRAVVPAHLLAGVKAAINATGAAPVYACRAWVNFDGTAAGTFAGGASTVTRIAASTTATVTCTNPHGLVTGQYVEALSGVVAGTYQVTVTNATVFTFTTVATSSLAGVPITFAVSTIRGSGNVSSVADNGVGDYTINFTTSLPDVNYAAIASASSDGYDTVAMGTLVTATHSSVASSRVRAYAVSSAAVVDIDSLAVAFFR